MHKITTEIDKVLKQIAKKLPATWTTYDSFGLQILPNRKINHFRASFDIVPDINPTILNDGLNIAKVPKQRMFPVKHIRRLRKAYINNGNAGVREYVKWVGENNTMLNEADKTEMIMKLNTQINALIL